MTNTGGWKEKSVQVLEARPVECQQPAEVSTRSVRGSTTKRWGCGPDPSCDYCCIELSFELVFYVLHELP